MELCKRGRKAIGSGPVPLGEDSEEKGDYTGRDSPWGQGSLRQILGSPALGSDTRKMSLVGGLEGLWNLQEEYGKPGLHS